MRIAIKWGLILSLALLVWTGGVHLLGIYTTHIQYAAVVDMAATVIPIVALTFALIEKRRAQNLAPSFGAGLLTGVTVAAISAPITVAGLWYYHHYVNPEWLSLLVEHERRQLTAAGVPANQIAASIAQLHQSGEDRRQVISGLIGTVAMGLVLSVVITTVLTLIDRMKQRRLRCQ